METDTFARIEHHPVIGRIEVMFLSPMYLGFLQEARPTHRRLYKLSSLLAFGCLGTPASNIGFIFSTFLWKILQSKETLEG